MWCWGEDGTLGRDGDTSRCTGHACPTPALVRAGDSTAADADDVERMLLSDYGGCYTTHTTGLMLCWGTHDYEAPLGTGMVDGARARTVQLGAGAIMNTGTFTVFGSSAISSEVNTNEWFGWGTDRGDVMHRGSVDASLDGAVSLGTGWAAMRDVVANGTHACAIIGDASNHQVTCWGSNAHGESAPGVSADPVGPTVVPGVEHVTQIVLGLTHACALSGGQLICWGDAASLPGATGCHTAICRPTTIDTTPLVIDTLWPVSDADDFCASDGGGHLYCWGAGYGSFGASVPTPVPNLPRVASAWLTWSHGCAIDSNAQTWCWGNNAVGQLGIGTVDDASHAATLVQWP
jgi:hypothetical protein